MPQICISKTATSQLSEISKKRKAEDSLVSSKKGIVEALIDKAFKIEINEQTAK